MLSTEQVARYVANSCKFTVTSCRQRSRHHGGPTDGREYDAMSSAATTTAKYRMKVTVDMICYRASTVWGRRGRCRAVKPPSHNGGPISGHDRCPPASTLMSPFADYLFVSDKRDNVSVCCIVSERCIIAARSLSRSIDGRHKLLANPRKWVTSEGVDSGMTRTARRGAPASKPFELIAALLCRCCLRIGGSNVRARAF